MGRAGKEKKGFRSSGDPGASADDTRREIQISIYFASCILLCLSGSDQDERGVIHCERETFAR